MKKFIYMMAGVLCAAAVSSCADTAKPVLQTPDPSTFIVNRPPLQNEYLATTGDMEDVSTFNLTCSQPDYGFALQAIYGAQVSMDPEFVEEVVDDEGNVVVPANYYSIDNQDANNASMSLRTYDLAVAMTSLLGLTNEDDFADYVANGGKVDGFTVYFRATCQVAGVPSSYVVSSNTVSYNNVALSYAVRKAGVVYYCGDVVGSGSFTTPSKANQEFYDNYKLVEPEIGCKIYAATIELPKTDDAHPGLGAGDVNYNTQFRFFTELTGNWDDLSIQVGSNVANFYVEPIGDKFSAGTEDGSEYKGDGVWGQGNWGIFLEENTPVTLVLNLVDKDKPTVAFKFGTWNVEIVQENGVNTPVFKAVE